jgi:glycosyltransferase involved in cell wall biosynthesis
MKNILIVNCVFDPEPVVSAQIGKSLAESLYESGENVTVIAPYPSRPMGFDFINNSVSSNKILAIVSKERLNCFNLPSFTYSKSGIIGRLRESISFGKASYRFIVKSKIKYDIVYMNTWPIFGQLGVALACLKTRTPYVIHIMDIYPESITNRLPRPFIVLVNLLLMPFEKIILKNARLIIAISNKMKVYLQESRKLNSDKISVVYNWQDEKDFNLIPRSSVNDKKVFMFLGNIGPVAGIPFLIECFSGISAKLIIAGSGSYKEHCQKIAEKYPNTDVEFIDVPAGKVAEIQSLADVMLLPILKGSANTSIPSKLPAYMFSKKPILVMADSGSDSVITVVNAKCGWTGEYGDASWLTNSINDILDTEDQKLQQMGLSGFYYAKENFSKTKNLNKLKSELLN